MLIERGYVLLLLTHKRISEKPLLYNLSEDKKKKAVNIFIFKSLPNPHLLFFAVGIPASLSSTSIIYLKKKKIPGSHSNFKG